MTTMRIVTLATAGIVLHLAAGCTPTRTGTDASAVAFAATGVGDEILIGQSLSGDRCRLRKTTDLSASSRVEQFGVYCGAWESPSGFLWRAERVDATAMRQLISDPQSPIWDSAALTCDPIAETSVLDGVPALVRRCTDDGGWPNVVVAARSAATDRVFLGVGLTHFVPVYEAAVAALSGRDADARLHKAGVRSRLLALAESEIDLNGHTLALADVHTYWELTRLGALYNQAGDFVSAERAHRSAVEVQEKFRGLDHPSLGITLASIALNKSNLGDQQTAERAFARAEPLVARSIPRHMAQHLAYKGVHVGRYGDPLEALYHIGQSVELRVAQFGQDSPYVAYAYYLEGGLLARADQHRAAAYRFETALQIFEELADPVWTAFTLEWLAETHRQLGNYARAREQARRAVELAELTFGSGVRLTQALAKLALIERDAGRTDAALATFERATGVAVADRVAARYLKTADVAPDLALLLEEAERQPALAAELHRKAFLAAQAPQDQTTGRAIGLMAARLAEGDPAIRDLVRELQDATVRRQAAGVALGREQLQEEAARDAEREAALKDDVAAAAAQVSALERRLMVEFPRYGTLIAPTVLEPEALARPIAPGEALVQALVSDEGTFVFLIRDDGTLRAHRSPIGGERLEEAVAGLRRTLDPTRPFERFDPQAAFDLYHELFGELDRELDSIEHLIVVPSGPLLSLPPAVLVRERPADGIGNAEVAWLVRDMAISVLPSIGSLEQLRSWAHASTAPWPFLGVGDPIFPPAPPGDASGLWSVAAECREDQVVDPLFLRGVPPLPETRDELAAIATTLGAGGESLLLGEHANEATVRAADLGQYRTLAFATHGLLPNELPCQSEPALMLTPPAEASEADDGLLDASEVAQLQLDADWVVLSACNTAGPDGQLGGESLSGLARAFFYAGARSLLVTHWRVESQSAVILTTGTFQRYAEGMSKAEALRQTQLAMIGDPAWADPALWAAYTLVGAGGTNAGPLVATRF